MRSHSIGHAAEAFGATVRCSTIELHPPKSRQPTRKAARRKLTPDGRGRAALEWVLRAFADPVRG